MPTALRNRAFTALLLGTFASNLGGWMHNFASRWLIYDLTGDALWLGLDALLSGMTTALLLPWGGVLADRMSRRTLLIVGNAVSAFNVALLAVLAATGRLEVWQILIVTFINGVVNAALVPANQALLPGVVGKAALSNAIALNSLQFNIARVGGPLIAWAAYTLGAAWCFGLNAVCFLVLLGVLWCVRVPPLKTRHEKPWAALVAGVRHVGGRRDLTAILALVVMTAFFSAPAISMLPALVKGEFGLDEAAFSIVQAAFGVGAVIGALALALRSKGDAHPWRVTGLLAAMGACEIVLLWSRWYILATAMVLIIGVTLIGTMIRLGAANQHAIGDEIRGRVMSLQSLAFRGGQAGGSFVAGALAGAIGLRETFGLYGALLIVGVVIVGVLVVTGRVRYRKVEDEQTAAR